MHLLFICFFILLSLALSLALSIKEASFYMRSRRRFFACALVCLGALAVIFVLGRDVVVRGGFGNEHDFVFQAVEFFKDMQSHEGRLEIFKDKESSPLALMAAINYLTGFSLHGFLRAQKVLWVLYLILFYGALRLFGLGRGTALAGAGLLGLNFLAILNTVSFSTTNINIFYIGMALYALAAWRAEPDPGRILERLIWLFAASYLVLTSRMEVIPVVLLGMLLSVRSPGAGALRAYWNKGLKYRTAVASSAAVYLTGFVLTAFHLASSAEVVRDSPAAIAGNINAALGGHILSPLLGLPSVWASWLTGILFCAAVWPVLRNKSGRSNKIFNAAFFGGWLIYFSLIFIPVETYPLSHMRHHLYFFLPVCLFAASGLNGWIASGRRNVSAPRIAAAAMLLVVYIFLNSRVVSAYQAHWRSNDREWQFLTQASRQWPKSCFAVYLHGEDNRAALLRKYFPYRELAQAKEGECLLAYRSLRHQVLHYFPDRFSQFILSELGPALENPWKEEVFSHRFYTESHGPWNQNHFEDLRSFPVTLGFYRYRSSPASLARARASRKLLLEDQKNRPHIAGRKSERSRTALEIFAPIRRPQSLEFCYVNAFQDSISGEKEGAPYENLLHCFHQAEQEFNKEGPRSAFHLAQTLAYKARVLDAMNRNREAMSIRRQASRLVAPAGKEHLIFSAVEKY